MKDQREFDYIFILWGIPLRSKPGAVNRQIYSLASKLSMEKKKVGIIFVSYHSVTEKYKIDEGTCSSCRLRLLISRILYSRLLSRIILYFYKIKNNNLLDPEIKLFTSGIYLPELKARKIVTSYWWAVLLAGELYPHEDIYFIVYHDYYNDIIHSNKENLPELEKAYKSSNLILANKELIKRFNGNYPLITEGIDTEKFRCIDNLNKKVDNMVLIPLRNNPLKGVEYAIPALKLIHDEFPEAKIVAYGDFQGNIPDFIDFKHVISDEMLKVYYCKATYFILPSVVEGIPEPLLEAMAGGCACISTTCGGPQEVITDGVNGILVPVKDPRAIFIAFKKLYSNKILTRSIMDRAMKTIANYDLNRTYEDFINAINFYRNK